MEVVIMILQVIGVIIGILIGLFILELAIVALAFRFQSNAWKEQSKCQRRWTQNHLGQEKM